MFIKFQSKKKSKEKKEKINFKKKIQGDYQLQKKQKV